MLTARFAVGSTQCAAGSAHHRLQPVRWHRCTPLVLALHEHEAYGKRLLQHSMCGAYMPMQLLRLQLLHVVLQGFSMQSRLGA